MGRGGPIVTCAAQGHTLSLCSCLAPCWSSVSAEEVQQSASTVSRALGFSSVSHPLHPLLQVSNTVNESGKLPGGKIYRSSNRIDLWMSNGDRLCPYLPRYQTHQSLISCVYVCFVRKASFRLWKFHKLSPPQERRDKTSCTILLPPVSLAMSWKAALSPTSTNPSQLGHYRNGTLTFCIFHQLLSA